jgi:hypothetical protein
MVTNKMSTVIENDILNSLMSDVKGKKNYTEKWAKIWVRSLFVTVCIFLFVLLSFGCFLLAKAFSILKGVV